MDTKSKLTEYYKVFCANIYDGKRMEENLKSIQVALVLLSLFSFIMSVSYLLIADYRMMASAIVLCCLFAGTYISGMRTGKRAMPLILCMLGVMVVFTYYIFSGGNNSFSILWTLLAPVFIMSAVGVKAGTVVGAYFQTIFIIVFWTPLRSIVEEHYSPTFLNHFPILYLCTLIICLAVVLNQKKQQMELDCYQEKLEKAVKEERVKVTQITFQTIADVEIITQIQLQLGSHDLNVHGFDAVINCLDLLRCQIHLLQLGIQVSGADHAFLFTLLDQTLQCSLQFLGSGLTILLCSTHVIPLFIFGAKRLFSHAVKLYPENYFLTRVFPCIFSFFPDFGLIFNF